MRQVLFTAIIAIAFGFNANAQSKKNDKSDSDGLTFKKGDKVLSLGIAPVSGYGLPINVGFEIGVKDEVGPGNIGIGGIIGYASKNYGVIGLDYKVTSLLIGVRGNYHYQFVDKLDTYLGLTIGYNAASVKYPSNWIAPKIAYGGIIYGTVIGGRYYFTPKVAGALELGFGGLGSVNLGLAVKL